MSLDENRETLRSAMICGHAITPNCLVAYIFNELKEGKYNIVCPYVGKFVFI